MKEMDGGSESSDGGALPVKSFVPALGVFDLLG